MEHANWKCPKCRNRTFETSEFRTAGGRFAKVFNVDNRRFTTLSCNQCQYTELYRADSSKLMNVLDFLTN
jgi:predicted nucleic-acid-binding Zn-ribbon protein